MTNSHEPLDNDTSYDTGKSKQVNLEQHNYIKYVVHSNPNTGVGSVGELKQGGPNRYPRRAERLPQTSQASARASRKRLRDHAVHRQLGACLVLTYAELPSNPKRDVEKFIKEAKTYYPNQMHYAVVTEGLDPRGGIRVHHNVLFPASPHLAVIAGNWIHGDVFVGINPTDSDIRRMVNYVTKEFVRSSGLGARFMKSKSKVPKPKKEIFNNKEDAEAALLANIPENATGISIYDPRCADRKIIYWDVHPHQIEPI
jgi:hypothetical protein